jgi:hypothetical protein
VAPWLEGLRVLVVADHRTAPTSSGRCLGLEDAVVEACRVNLMVWERHLDGIADAGDQERARPCRRRAG